GADGHTASIFPGDDFDEALNGPRERRALGVRPAELPKEAPVDRITLSRAAIVSARTLILTITGGAKRDLVERAIEEGAASPTPIGRVLADCELPVDIHWAP
ncbi:MAG TPA: 6-phosphogluconolactonase, partial [Sphingomonas sp.]|nr:6-phosphogluconolactonase [Sphingomonas sp.]